MIIPGLNLPGLREHDNKCFTAYFFCKCRMSRLGILILHIEQANTRMGTSSIVEWRVCAGLFFWHVVTHGSALLSSGAWRPLRARPAWQPNGACSARGSALSWRALEKIQSMRECWESPASAGGFHKAGQQSSCLSVWVLLGGGYASITCKRKGWKDWLDIHTQYSLYNTDFIFCKYHFLYLFIIMRACLNQPVFKDLFPSMFSK